MHLLVLRVLVLGHGDHGKRKTCGWPIGKGRLRQLLPFPSAPLVFSGRVPASRPGLLPGKTQAQR